MSRVDSALLEGVQARAIRVEAEVALGLPSFSIAGMPEVAVREEREVLRAAILNSGFEFPAGRISVKLTPSGPRQALSARLALAAAVLSASGQLDPELFSGLTVAGDLALDGTTRAVPGALAIAEAAREAGSRMLVLAAASGPEAALADGIDVLGLESLGELAASLSGEQERRRPRPLELRPTPGPGAPDLAELRGQPQLRRALEVAAAGGHGLLMIGPPGSGRSLAALRLPSILPPLLGEEALEVARIAGACGRLGAALEGRPFRAPHHTISAAGLLGGGGRARPGEVTLAHRGVLYLDEVCEFRRDALESLGEPLASGKASIERGGRRQTFPAQFMLIAAAGPCPCGRGEADPECSCAPAQVCVYRARLSGALRDRLDLRVAVKRPSAAEIGGAPGEPSAAVRERVLAARERAEGRLGHGTCNAAMSSAQARSCSLSAEARALLSARHAGAPLTGPARDRSVTVARTIADLQGSEVIDAQQLAEALELGGWGKRG